MKGFSYLQHVATVKLDRETCIGCGMCSEVCPHQVFEVKEKKAGFVSFNSCMECGACAVNCPVSAIRVESGVGCASGMINEWLSSINIKRRGGAGCC
jgi:ferredoxin